ncbi:MAG TPA: archaetidylserine decarboxylase [Gammaproteobacteria bacterium]|nr:archaetidylserine decarboxylase [Gammaproteobacteria bacterium]
MPSSHRFAASPWDRALAAAQYPLPQHLLSRMVRAVARSPRPWLRDFLIRRFIRRYGVDMSEAERPDPRTYRDFNAFFTRPLRGGARPLAGGAGRVLCPVDCRISQIGPVTAGRILQAKGRRFDVAGLLGDERLATRFRDGIFATLYLAPHDYHRVHAPVSGMVTRMIHVPGRLFSVNPATTRAVPRLFARNERVVCLLEGTRGSLAVVLVGAMLVGSIETVWAGEITPPRGRGVHDVSYGTRPPRLEAGAELGRFNMGSTVIVLAERGLHRRADLCPGQEVRVGERLGDYA